MPSAEYIFHSADYDPTQDQIPPPKQSTPGCLKFGCFAIIALAIGAGVFFVNKNNQKASEAHATETAIAAIPSLTPTLDDWSATGTAIFWLTYTPTPTIEASFTPTSTGTVTPDIPASMTALYIILNPQAEASAELTAGPTSKPNKPKATAKPSEPNIPGPGGSDSPPPPQPTPKPQTQVITRVVPVPIPVPVIVTATPQPLPSATRTPTATLTLTATMTLTATASPTLTDVPTATPTETETPTATPTETPTATPTATEWPTATLEPTLTEVPTEIETPTEIPMEVNP